MLENVIAIFSIAIQAINTPARFIFMSEIIVFDNLYSL